ncbi:MAG: putative zinc-binding dehydrogenase [Candidatus Carbobacillus altaicus]|uniref:Putative zinc-binding dehydrogenase n=1 Tax=Candidatus Carbonibacillus altaicus TaxID=2163959 RepID=A0A2R6Y3S6_9BACL|nr:MAG: putative zinc-binding dehydrogenase [Candidatus Carbobacillus altaicus]
MKAVVAHAGEADVLELAVPELRDNSVLVKTHYSAVSTGTELMLLGQSRHKAEPVYLGYSAAGEVVAVGAGVKHVGVGDRVACYGSPYVRHAEYLLVPKQLVVPIPAQVDLREAAFVGLGAIAIHALRQADLHFGEHVVIVGLGILGQIIAQVAHAAAFNVLAHDILRDRCRVLQDMGIGRASHAKEELAQMIDELTDGEGVDAVILSTQGGDEALLNQAFKWVRDRGSVLIVGDMNVAFSRELMYEKEARVLISRAGGPGRYDERYERDGHAYPIGYVRWTEHRNMYEFIRLLATNRVHLAPLFTHRAPVEEAPQFYRSLIRDERGTALGVIIEY